MTFPGTLPTSPAAARRLQEKLRRQVRLRPLALKNVRLVGGADTAVDRARGEGMPAGLIRPITLWPFPSEPIARAAEEFRVFLTVEMSMGQMLEDVKLAVAGKAPVLLYGRAGGGVPTVEEVLEKIRELTIRSSKAQAASG